MKQKDKREKSLSKNTKWSSYDPLSIPLQTRKEQFSKGNLVLNSGFEHGVVHPTVSSADISPDNWIVLGEHVEWVDADHDAYSADEVSSGGRAIKIVREKANETDEKGEGVESDFIPVIPGNYLFTYDVKLKDIYSNKPRFGMKLYDAIDVRLLFFDAEKQPLDGKTNHPHYHVNLDNSFKGFTFSNFWHIDDFDWANVRARTFNYPFSEGDIPDACRYVKIFLGLKGKGTMWVDNVEFKFSRWNFTTVERLAPYFDSVFSATDLLIPAPKQVGPITPLSLSSDPDTKPTILIPPDAGSATLYAADTLRERMQSAIGSDIEITTEISNGLLESDRLIFSIGRTALLKDNIAQLPFAEIEGKEQGYFTKRPAGRPNIIYLAGNEDVGDFYAVASAIQLFDKREAIYHHADIIDYPDFLGRSFRLGSLESMEAIDRDLDGIDRLAAFKLNKIYNGYGDWGKDWLNPSQTFLDGIEAAGKKCEQLGVVDLAVQFNPYYHFEYEMHVPDIPTELKYYWLHSNSQDVERLIEGIRTCFDCGATCLMLLADDFVPHEADYRKIYSLWTQEDKDRFVNLQNAQAHVINEIYDMLEAEYPGARFEFCPPWYLNEFIDRSRGHAEQYFRDLIAQIPEDVAIIWTGNTVRSLSYDMADIERYRELIGRYPMLWDNTLYARRLEGSYGGYPGLYPGKVRMCNIFEPYDIYLPKDFHEYNDGKHIYQNGGSHLEYQKIKYITVADYEWNTGAYDPDFSLWKALYTQFGKEIAVKLLEFNDNYYGLVDMTMRIEREGKSEEYVSKAEKYRATAENLLDELSRMPAMNMVLVDELRVWQQEQVGKYSKLGNGHND